MIVFTLRMESLELSHDIVSRKMDYFIQNISWEPGGAEGGSFAA